MATEIERKFLVKGDFSRQVTSAQRIVQGYICSQPGRTVRIRIRGEEGFLTIKGASDEKGLSRYEFEQKIPLADAEELLKHHELIRVATKYPHIAKDYFYNKKHQTVEIIKLNGSIELAPIVGLSEVICDIVETGSTLRENGLVVLEEVCPLSARMVVNQVSMKMENERITKLIADLKREIERKDLA